MLNYLTLPNLPEGQVKLVIVDGRINKEIEDSLNNLGIKIIKTLQHPDLYPAIAYHPDMMIHHISERKIVFAPNTPLELLLQLEEQGFILYEGKSVLNASYPFCIPYNVARIGNIAFHNTKYTDSVLLKMLQKEGVRIFHVNQGYTKCSTMVVSEKVIITSDIGIHNCAKVNGIDSLMLPPQKNIQLPGIEYGFIGGCSGLINSKLVALTGSLSKMESSSLIFQFLLDRGISIHELSQNNVIDIGSIIPLFHIMY